MIFSRAFFYIDLEKITIITKLITMKKILYIALFLSSSVAFTSCASGDECSCDSGLTITEDDAKDSGVSLSEACTLAKINDSSCSIK